MESSAKALGATAGAVARDDLTEDCIGGGVLPADEEKKQKRSAASGGDDRKGCFCRPAGQE